MAKQVTKAAGNRYCQARLKAAKYNDKLFSRAGAVEHLPGVTEDSLKKYELDITRPPNTVVALMADAYNEPELRIWYCANECPLGKDCREIPEMPPERAVLRLSNYIGVIEEATRQMSKIMDDGKLSEEEAVAVPMLKEHLSECGSRIKENIAILEKAERTGRFT